MTHSESIIEFKDTEELVSATLWPQTPFLYLVHEMMNSETTCCHFHYISCVRSKSLSTAHAQGLKELHLCSWRREYQRVLKLPQSTQWPQIIYSPPTCKTYTFQTSLPKSHPTIEWAWSPESASKSGSVKATPWMYFLQCNPLSTVLNLHTCELQG